MRLSLTRGLRLGVLCAVMAAVAVPIAVAGAVEEVTPLSPPPSAESGQPTVEVPGAWFVELESKPTAAGGDAASVRADKEIFRKAAKAAGVKYTERFAFDTLWNGLSIQVSSADAGKLVGIKGVTAVYPITAVPPPPTMETADPELLRALAMTGADIAQTELGYTGEGVRVAVMDSGIDLDHADLGGDGVAGAPHPNSRVAAQWDFVGDAFDADPASTTYNPTPAPDQFADDCPVATSSTGGHGTHVSGIVGANGTVKGVAPEVTFGAYRVFGCNGSTTTDIMIAAMERALEDDMDVLNMSIGSAFSTWPQHPTAAAADALVDAGMVVVTSIGNSGASGTYSASSPGVGTKVTGVASYDNTHTTLNAFRITPDGRLIGYTNAAAAPLAPTSGSLPMTKATTVEGCDAVGAGTYAGKAVLVRRGTCAFHAKALNAQNGGAAAVVLYNNAPGRVSPTVAGTPPITIPVVAISQAEGLVIDGFLTAGPVTLTWTAETLEEANPTGGLISAFSSYGLAADLDVKPDLGAPGGFIRSTYPLEKGAFASVSGTSMSSPHVAGAAALFLQAHPGTDPLALRSALQNSADPKNWSGNPGLGFLDHVHRQGAGMLDIDDAILATTRITPGKLALGESQAGPQTRALTLQNGSPLAVTYNLSFVNALSTSLTNPTGPATNPLGVTTGDATVAFSQNPVTVPAGGSAIVHATITASTGPDKSQYGGYIVFTPQGGGQVHRVPYAGFVGDYQSIQVLTTPNVPSAVLAPAGSTVPALAKLTSCAPGALLRGLDCFGTAVWAKQSALATFNLTNAIAQTPYVLLHFEHQARRLEIEVLTASGKKLHPVFSNVLEFDFLPRNATATSFFALPWDGLRLHDSGRGNGDHLKLVPDGQYKLVVKVLKALGDPGSPAHWETWTSPTFTIDRP